MTAEQLSEVANSLQVVASLIDRLRVTSQQNTIDCDEARVAIARIVTVLRVNAVMKG